MGEFWIVKQLKIKKNKIMRENNNKTSVIEDRSSPLDMNFN